MGARGALSTRGAELLCALLCFLLLSSVSAWSTGSGTCDADSNSVLTRTTRHPMAPTMQFYLSLPSNYIPGAMYNVSIMNTGRLPPISYFNGFLLYATNNRSERVGTFTNPPPGVTVNMNAAAEAERDRDSGLWTCYGAPRSTATHSDGGIKEPNFPMQWTAPSTDVGMITFRGLVESSGILYYLQVLQPQFICPPGRVCPAFNTSALPTGPLPTPPNANYVPAGLAPADRTACAEFPAVPFAAIPPGFCASIYANDLNRPRGIYVTPAGDLLVVETGYPQGIALLRDLNGDGSINRENSEYLRLINLPSLNHGLYVHGGFIYVSNATTVWRIPFDHLQPALKIDPANATIVVRNLPEPRNHGTRTPLVSHDLHWLYVSVGSAGNLDDDDRRARVIRYDLTRPVPPGGWQWDNYDQSGGAVQAFARGLRNEVGLTLDLQGEVWGVMNADDNLNRPDLGGFGIHNNNPAERLDHLREENMQGWYGYPFCWAVDILANHSRGEIFAWGGDGKDWYLDGVHTDRWCRENTLPPTYAMQAHTAPLGLLFYDGKGRYAFPPEFYNQIFVGMHGSWNSDSPRGYKIIRIETDQRGQPIRDSARDFFAYEGPGAISVNWPHKPVDVRLGVNGEMFFSSDTSNAILVLRYINPQQTPVLISQDAVAGSMLDSSGGPTKAWVDFSFDRDPSRSTGNTFLWINGTQPHMGVAVFTGKEYIDATRYDTGAGTVMPNVTGGPSSYEIWLRATGLDATAFHTIVELADNATGTLDDVISIGLRSRVGSSVASLVVRLDASRGSQGEFDVRDAVPQQNWTHIIVTLEDRHVDVFINGELRLTQFINRAPRRMSRSSALIGTGVYGTGMNLPLQGGIDVLRLYSYPMTPPQIRLNYLLSFAARMSPVLYGHFAMQPMESSEPTFQFRGAANRRLSPQAPAQPPPPADELFPGWAHFGRPYDHVNLLNPNNGIGAVWPNGRFLFDEGFSVELWLRLDQQTSGVQTPLHVPGLLLLSVDGGGSVQALTSTSSLTAGASFAVWRRWTHIVWTVQNTRNSSMQSLYINGALATSSSSQGRFEERPIPMAFLGGDPRSANLSFSGDIAAFRVYSQPLNAETVQISYDAQMYGHQQPISASSSSSSSSAATAAPATVSSSASPSMSTAVTSTTAPLQPTSATAAPTSQPIVPTVPPTSAPFVTSSLSSSATALPTPTSTSTGQADNSSEPSMSMAAYVAIVLIVLVVLIAVIVAIVVCLRRRKVQSTSSDDRLNRLIPEGESGDSYSRL